MTPSAGSTHPSVLAVVVNYRTPGLTIDCLQSLAAERSRVPGMRAAVIDGASGDDSVPRLREAIDSNGWGKWAELMPLDRNGGFSFANNAAIRPALDSNDPPDYVLLVNPDAVVRPGAVERLLEFMAAHPDAGIAGSRVYDGDDQLEHSAHAAPRPWHECDRLAGARVFRRFFPGEQLNVVPSEAPVRCGWVSGASMMVRREVFRQIGLLDEGYFLYFDETDFCTRARRAGWDVWYVPGSDVTHLGGQATGVYEIRKRRAPYWYASRRRYWIKNHGLRGLILADAMWALGRVIFHLRRPIPGPDRRRGLGPRMLVYDQLGGDLRAILTGKAFRIRRGGER